MQMKNDEIVMRYRQAKHKGNQVQILAELNNCPVERIIGILVANGIDNRNFNRLRNELKKHIALSEEPEQLPEEPEQLLEEEPEPLPPIADEEREAPGTGQIMEEIPPEPIDPFPKTADKQGYKEIDLLEVGECVYEDGELIDAFGEKVNGLIERRSVLMAEVTDIDLMLAKYLDFTNKLHDSIERQLRYDT